MCLHGIYNLVEKTHELNKHLGCENCLKNKQCLLSFHQGNLSQLVVERNVTSYCEMVSIFHNSFFRAHCLAMVVAQKCCINYCGLLKLVSM